MAKCFALSSVIEENFEVSFEKKANSVFLAEFKLIKNLPSIQSPTNKKTTPHWGVINKPSPLDEVLSPTIGPNRAKAIKPVNKLSFNDWMISFFSIKPFQYQVFQEIPLERKLKLQLKH